MAFLLGPDELRRLSRLLTENVVQHIPPDTYGERDISYGVGFSDGSSMETDSLDDVLDLPNGKRRITSLSVHTPYGHDKIRASLRLNETPYSMPVRYDLAGEDKEVLALADKLDEYLVGLRQWYSPLARFSFVGFLAAAYMLVYIGANLIVFADYLFFPNLLPGYRSGQPPADTSSGLTTVFVVGAIAMIALMAALDWVFKRIFPVSTFTIGQGAKRNRNLNYVRGVVLTAVVIPVLLQLANNLLS